MAYDHEKLRKYILGELDEKASDEFGELIVCDPDFADELSTVESEMLDEFVNGELDTPTTEKLRLHYSATEYRRQKLAFARAMSESAGTDPILAAAPAKTNVSSLWSYFFGLAKPVWAAVAVTTMVGAGVLVWLLLGRDNRLATTNENSQTPSVRPASPTPTPLPTANVPNAKRAVTPTPETNRNRNAETSPPRKPFLATFVLRPALRGSSNVQTLTVSAETREATFKLNLEPNDFEAFDVALADESGGRTFWTGNKIKAGGGVLTIGIRAGLPRNRILVFTVKGARDGKSEPLGTYVFRLEDR